MSQKTSLPVTIAATQAHRQFGMLIRRAFLGKEHFVIEKDGLPVAIILSVAEHAELIREYELREQETQVRLCQFREAAQAIGAEVEKMGLTNEQMINLLEETLRQVYQKYSSNVPS